MVSFGTKIGIIIVATPSNLGAGDESIVAVGEVVLLSVCESRPLE